MVASRCSHPECTPPSETNPIRCRRPRGELPGGDLVEPGLELGGLLTYLTPAVQDTGTTVVSLKQLLRGSGQLAHDYQGPHAKPFTHKRLRSCDSDDKRAN